MKKLVSIVTICALMVSIGAFSIFGETIPLGTYGSLTLTGYSPSDESYDTNVQIFIYAIDYNPYYNIINQYYDTSNTLKYDVEYAQDYTFLIQVRNKSDRYIYLNSDYISVEFTLANNTDGSFNNLPTGYRFKDGNGEHQFIGINNTLVTVDYDYYYGSKEHKNLSLAPQSSTQFQFTVTRYVLRTNVNGTESLKNSSGYFDRKVNTIKLWSPVINKGNVNYLSFSYADYLHIYNNTITTREIDDNVQSILDQYTANAQNAQAVKDGTQNNEQALSNIHQNEDTWFTQNDQALTATGMDDFTYTPQVMSGLTVISDQFNQLWTAIGDWNFVYTFSMMIGLVVLILRHNPQRKKSSSGGKSNASSS